MTPIQRFQTALTCREPDRVPWTPFFLGASNRIYGAPYDHWSQYGDIAAKCLLASRNFFNFDVILAAFDAYTESAAFGQQMFFPEDEAAYPDPKAPVIRTPDDYARLIPYDPRKRDTRTGELIECCDILMNEEGKDIPVIVLINSPFMVLAGLSSTNMVLDGCKRHKEAVLKGLEIVSRVLLDYTEALAETGAMIMFDTSYASRQMMDSRLWLETEGRFMPHLAETARRTGAQVAVYSRSQGPYFDRLMESMAPRMMAAAAVPNDCADWSDTKRQWGDRVALFGAVPIEILASGKTEEIKASCRNFIRDMGAGGGFILSPGCEYPPKANLHGARVMKETVEQYGMYSAQA